MPVLFADILGVKKRWRPPGGVARVLDACRALEELAGRAVEAAGSPSVSGGIDSDAMAIGFPDALSALRAGVALFQEAYAMSVERPDERLWLRGVVAPAEADTPLVHDVPLGEGPLRGLLARRYSPALLDAINVEHAGVKGARLLVFEDLITPDVASALQIECGKRAFHPVRALTHSTYPTLGISLADVLWMVPNPYHQEVWIERASHVPRLMRIAGTDFEEFTHVAATALVFSQVEAILRSLGALDEPPGGGAQVR